MFRNEFRIKILFLGSPANDPLTIDKPNIQEAGGARSGDRPRYDDIEFASEAAADSTKTDSELAKRMKEMSEAVS
jgi:hypothetical protein